MIVIYSLVTPCGKCSLSGRVDYACIALCAVCALANNREMVMWLWLCYV